MIGRCVLGLVILGFAVPTGAHEDLGAFRVDTGRRRIVLRQVHVEGFVNQNVMEPPASSAPAIVFTTEAIENVPAGWRARENARVRQNDRDAALVPALQRFAFLL